jgi:hypothetical protein
MNSVVPLYANPARPTLGATPALVRTIDLTTVRVHVGTRFSAIADQLHARMRQDMQQMLGANGWFNPIGDLFYLIVLWGTNEEAASDLLQRLLKRVHGHLRDLKIDTAGLFIPVNAAHLDRRGRAKVDAIQSLEEGDDAASAPTPASVPAEDRASFAFEPVWNVRQGVVSAFRCIRLESSSTATNGELADADKGDTARLASQDQGLLRHAVSEWSKLPSDAVCLLIVPVHFEMLAGAGSRREYLTACASVPAPLKRLLIFEIDHMPDGVLPARLLEIARHMKPFCRAVTARVSFDYQGFDTVQKAGIPIVACHVGGSRTEQQYLQLMERFVERAEKYKLQTGVYGIRSVSLTTAALAAGFVYIGGEAVSTLAETPRGLFKFDMADIYRTQMDS